MHPRHFPRTTPERRLQNMVQVTKGKKVVIETYDAEFKEQIYMPKAKNGAYSVQQAIQMKNIISWK
jgi:hypothetical protein